MFHLQNLYSSLVTLLWSKTIILLYKIYIHYSYYLLFRQHNYIEYYVTKELIRCVRAQYQTNKLKVTNKEEV